MTNRRATISKAMEPPLYLKYGKILAVNTDTIKVNHMKWGLCKTVSLLLSRVFRALLWNISLVGFVQN